MLFENINQKYLNSNKIKGLLDGSIYAYASKYTPYIFISYGRENYDKVSNVAKENAKNKGVKIIEEYDNSITFGDLAGTLNYQQFNNYGYTGYGVKIGISEAKEKAGDYGINSNNANFANINVYCRENLSCTYSNTSEHADLVASIPAGMYGVAKNSGILYSTVSEAIEKNLDDEKYYFTSTAVESIEWSITNGADVLNISWGEVMIDVDIKYTFTRFIDFLVLNTGIPIIVCVGNYGGNEGIDEDKIWHPGDGYNVFTVGSINSNNDISTFSSYEDYYSIYSNNNDKPNIVALGEEILVDNTDNTMNQGTSFAVPQVTGATALIMEKDNSFKTNPEMIYALLSASADFESVNHNSLNFESSGLDDKLGAGKLDIETALENTNNVYLYETNNIDNSIGDVIVYKNQYFEEGNISIALSWLQGIKEDFWDDLTGYSYLGGHSNYDVELYYNGEKVASSTSNYNNLELLRYTVNTSGYYNIRIRWTSNDELENNGSYNKQLALAIVKDPLRKISTPSLTKISNDPTRIKIKVTNNDEEKTELFVKLGSNNWISLGWKEPGQYGTYTFTGLNSGQSYSFSAYAKNGTDYNSNTVTKWYSTESDTISPFSFENVLYLY